MLKKVSWIKSEPVIWSLLTLPIFFYDGWIFIAIRDGRDAFLKRAGELSIGLSLAGLIGLTAFLIAHGASAFRIRKPEDDLRGHGSEGHRKLQKVSGVFVGIFILLHFRHTPYLAGIEGIGAAGLYERLRNDLDSYPWLALYVFGTAVVSLHLSQGIWAVSHRLLRSNQGLANAVSVLGILGVLILFALGIDAISMYATGGSLWGQTH